jgi:hypothetical protein
MELKEYIKDFFVKAYDEFKRLGVGGKVVMVASLVATFFGDGAIQIFGIVMMIVFILALRWGYDRP